MDKEPTIPEKAAKEMDEMLENVMPDSWVGHARLVVANADSLSPKQETFALKLSARLLEKGKTADAKKAARVSIKKAKEQY